MKKNIIWGVYCLFFLRAFPQIIFQEKFNMLSLSTHTTAYVTTTYTTIPSGFMDISEGYRNKVGSSIHPNAPFHTDSLKYKAWGVLYNPIIKDTFLVSTSWVDTNKVTSRWILLPVVNGISVNSVLHWKAMAPDPTYADGYAVYISTNTSVADTTIFNNSNKVFQLNDNSTSGGGEKQNWIQRSISLANYSGQSIRIAFKNISNQKYQLWLDDITVENLPYANDAALENVNNVKYVLVNQNFNLNARLKNTGYQTISNVQLAYSIQGITYNAQSFALNTNLLPLNTTTLAFTNTLSINTAGLYKVKIWINQLNGQSDQNLFNDTISYYLSVLNTSVSPKVLVEQMTDAGFPDAPANQDTLRMLQQTDTNVIAVQIHLKDSLKSNIANSFSDFLRVPDNALVATLNRQYFSSDNRNYFYCNELRSKINALKNFISPCIIQISNISADTNFRTIQLDVTTTFLQNAVGDYRVGVYLIENNVHGNPADTTINGFNQLSSFYFTPYSDYFQKGYFSAAANAFVLNAYEYHHQFVLNQNLTSVYGDASVIPTMPIAGNFYTKTYTLSVPTSTNGFKNHFDNFYIVAFVYEHDTLIENRKILNADRKKVLNSSELVSIQQVNKILGDISVYPNPVSDKLFLGALPEKFSAYIVDVMGQKILEVHSKVIDVSALSNGIYFLIIPSEDRGMKKKIIVQK